MKNVYAKFSTFVLIIGFNFACVKRASKAPDNSSIASQKPVVDPVAAPEKLKADLRNQHLDFEVEFSQLKQATTEFKASSIYNDPKNDKQRVLSFAADMLSDLSKDTIKELIQEKKIDALVQAFSQIETYRPQVNHALKLTEDFVHSQGDMFVPPDPGKATAFAEKNLAQENKEVTADSSVKTSADSGAGHDGEASASEGDHHEPNAYFLYATGGFVMLITAFGAYESGKRIVEIYKGGWAKYRDRFVKNIFVDTGLFFKVGFLVYGTAMMIESLAKNGKIDAHSLKEPLLVVSAVAGLAGLFWIFELGMNLRGKLTGITDLNGNWLDGEGYLKNKAGKILKNPEEKLVIEETIETKKVQHLGELKDGRVYIDGQEINQAQAKSKKYALGGEPLENFFAESKEGTHVFATSKVSSPTYSNEKYYKLNIAESSFGDKGLRNSWIESKGTRKAAIAKSAGGIFGALVVAAGTIAAYAQLGLTSDEEADVAFLARMMRFMMVCELLSAEGVLVLN